MKKIFLFILLITLLPFSSFIKAKAFSESYDNYTLMLDFADKNKLPLNFRKTTDLSKLANSNLDTIGLSELNISGSSQFTNLSLDLLIKNINTKLPITIIDLREEPHGLINSNAVYWKTQKNKKENTQQVSIKKVLDTESNLLSLIIINRPITLISKNKTKTLSLTPTIIQSESDLVRLQNLNYIRIPVVDNERPTDEIIDTFISFINNLTEDNWLHFHCDMGIGRTTTFMCMYDMMKNSNNIEFINILKRQALLGNINFFNFEENYIRVDFLKNFYQYTRNNKDNFRTSWSTWIKENNIEAYPNND